MPKKCAIGETECNEILSLYLRKTDNLSEEKEGMGESGETECNEILSLYLRKTDN